MKTRALVPTLGMFAAMRSATAAPFQDALRPAGVQAGHIGSLWNFTLGLCTLVFVLVFAGAMIALWRAPRANAQTPPDVSSLEQPESRTYRKTRSGNWSPTCARSADS